MKKIQDLPNDIYNLFTSSHEVSDENIDTFCDDLREILKTRVGKPPEIDKKSHLRMSNMGKPDRQLWYELNDENPREILAGQQYLRFLYGDLIELLLVFLIKESGHTIKFEQEELEIDGILGHTDGAIDGVPSDIKSASKYAFATKVKGGSLLRGDDPYGYIGQLSGYRDALLKKYPGELDEENVAWVSMCKETGELNVLMTDYFGLINPEDRISTVKEQLQAVTPPKRCHEDSEDGKSGNRVLPKGCQWCKYKQECWSDVNDGQGLRAFKYANSTKYLTKVNKLPKVEEIL